MSLDIFNSRLLDLVQRNYKGPAYSKLLEAFEILQSTNSVEQACSSLFRKSIAPIEAPSSYAFDNFGMGNVSQDFMTLLYLDDMLARAFELIKDKQYEEALNEILYPNEKVFAHFPRSKITENPTGGKSHFLEIPEADELPDERWTYQKMLPTKWGGKNAPTEKEKQQYRLEDMEAKKSLNVSPIMENYRGTTKKTHAYPYPGKPKDLLFRFEIYKGFIQFCQIKLDKPFAHIYLEYPPYPYLVENLDDMAVCGICGMFDRYFSDKDKSFFGLNFTISEKTPRKLLFGDENFYVPINVLINMQIKDYFGKGHYNSQFDTFVQMNTTYKIPDSRPTLNTSLSNLLASSSFIWDKEIFGISPKEVESMTNEERILLLASNQSGLIESCFSYLQELAEQKENESRVKALTTSGPIGNIQIGITKDYITLKEGIKKYKGDLVQLSLKIKQALEEQKIAQQDYDRFEKGKMQARASLEEIGSRMGLNSMQTLAEMLRYVEKGVEIPQLDLELGGFDQLVLQLLSEYRHNFFQAAQFREKAQEKTDQLKVLKQDLNKQFKTFIDSVAEKNLKNEVFGKRFLEAYTVFSFIVFNKDIFPDLPLTTYRKQQGAKKLLKIFEKKEKPLVQAQVFSKLKENAISGEGALITGIQELINKRVDKIFSAFKKPSNQGRIKTLSKKDLEAVIDVSRSIYLRKGEVADRFQKLTSVLKDMLLRDEIFWGSIDQLGNRVNSNKIALLQAHMNACLLFLEGQEASLATGLPKSVGFQKLMEEILYAIGDEGIKAKRLKEKNSLIEAIKEFNIPSETKSFDKAIKKEVTFSKKADIETLTVERLPARKDPKTENLGYILGKLKSYLLKQMTSYYYGGKSEFLQKKQPKKQTGSLSLDYILGKIPKKELNLSDRDINLLYEVIGSKGLHPSALAFTPEYIERSARDFVVENNVSTGIMNEQSFLNQLFYLQGYDILGITAAYQMLLETYKERTRALDNQKSYEVVQKHAGNPENQANVFNKTLIQWYEQKQKADSNNQDLALGMHRQFLPIFLSSFFSDVQDLNMGLEFFTEKKMELIKHLPEAEETFHDIKQLLQGKKGELKDLSSYLEESFKEEDFFSESWLAKTYQKVKNSFDLSTRQLMTEVSEFLLAAVILTVAANSTSLGVIPYLPTFIGLLGAYYWVSKIGPVVKDIFYFLKEGCKYVATEKYTNQGVNQFILGLIETAFKAGQKMIASPKWKDLRHELAFTLFLQEEFSMLRNMGSDLAVFPDRLNYLVPKSIANTNISCMAMNLFYMFNKELFTLLPDDLLKGADSPLFLDAIKGYLFEYVWMISRRKMAYQGSEEDKKLNYGDPSPFKRKLTEEANQSGLILEFPRTSKVYQFLQESKSNLMEKEVRFTITPNQIVPVDQISLPAQVENVRRFLELRKELLQEERLFLDQTALSMKKMEAVAIPLDQESENTALQGLISSYYMMRFCLSLAKKLYDSEDKVMGEEDRWLKGTGETPKDILTSTLFRESISVLRKTAEFALASELPGSSEALKILSGVEASVQDFMVTEILNLPSFQAFENLILSFQKIAANLGKSPQVMMPILLEYENNQNLFLPQILLQQGLSMLNQEFGENSQIVLQGNFHSKVLYLTNSDTELFFANRGARGFGLAPLMVDALNDIIRSRQDRKLLNYLGIMGNRKEQFLLSQQAVPRFRGQMQKFIPQMGQNALPYSKSLSSQNMSQNLLPMVNSQATGNSFIPQGSFYRPTYQNRSRMIENPNFQNNPLQNQMLGGLSGGNDLPVGHPNMLPSSKQETGISNPGNLNQENTMMSKSSQNNANMVGSQSNMMIPFMMGNTSEEKMMQEKNPLDINPSSLENPNLVKVDALGGSGSYSGGSNENELPFSMDERQRNLWEEGNRLSEENNANLIPNEPMNFLGQGNAPEYQNPFNPQPEDLVQERPEPFPIGKAALIGGGLVLGASLLSNMLKPDEKKRKR